MWGMNLKGVPALINSYMTWGVAYIGAIDLFAPLNRSTRNWNTDICISRPHLPQTDRRGGMRKAA